MLVNPKDCEFQLVENDISNDPIMPGEGDIILFIACDDEDDIRGLNGCSDFEFYWDNVTENIFSTNKMTFEEAKSWCLSKGMFETNNLCDI